MEKRIITEEKTKAFREHLTAEERSGATIEKYMRDIRRFAEFAGGSEITKKLVVSYKRKLMEEDYAARSINSMLASVNSLFGFLSWQDLRVKNLRLQKEIYCAEKKELKKAEYLYRVRLSVKIMSAVSSAPVLDF